MMDRGSLHAYNSFRATNGKTAFGSLETVEAAERRWDPTRASFTRFSDYLQGSS